MLADAGEGEERGEGEEGKEGEELDRRKIVAGLCWEPMGALLVRDNALLTSK